MMNTKGIRIVGSMKTLISSTWQCMKLMASLQRNFCAKPGYSLRRRITPNTLASSLLPWLPIFEHHATKRHKACCVVLHEWKRHFIHSWWKDIVSSHGRTRIPRWQLSKILYCPSLLIQLLPLCCILLITSEYFVWHITGSQRIAMLVSRRCSNKYTYIITANILACSRMNLQAKNISLRFRLAVLFTAWRDTNALKLCPSEGQRKQLQGC